MKGYIYVSAQRICCEEEGARWGVLMDGVRVEGSSDW